MVLPPQPMPTPPPAQGGFPLPGDPGAEVQRVASTTGAPLELVAQFQAAIPPEVWAQFLALGPAQQAQELVSFAEQARPDLLPGPGGVPGAPPVDAPAPPSPPPNGPPVGAPPGMPPGIPPELAALMQGGPNAPIGPIPAPSPAPAGLVPPVGQSDPMAAQRPPVDQKPPDILAEQPKLKQEREVPPPPVGRDLDKLKKRSRWGKRKPTIDEVLDTAEIGRRRYEPRNEHSRLVWKLIHLVPNKKRPDGTTIEPLAGEIYHTRSKPAVVYDRTVSIMEPFLDRLIVSTQAWRDDAETREASQAVENYDRQALANAYRKWDDHGTYGDPQPPFSRKLAGLILAEGLCGRRIFIDPDDDDLIFMEPVPAAELYPLAHATTRQLRLPLVEARIHYPEIDTALKEIDGQKHGWARAVTPDENEQVWIIHWADRDGLWEAIAWDWVSWRPGASGATLDKEKQWIKEPTEIGYGFCPLRYPAAFLGSPASHSLLMGGTDSGNDSDQAFQKYVNRGMFSAMLDSYEKFNELLAIYLTTANTVGNSPMNHFINPDHDDPSLFDANGKRIKPSRRIGAVNTIPNDEKFEPVPVDPAGLDALRTMMQSLMEEQGDTAPPVLSGRGEATSGADRFLAQQSAADYVITPAMKAAERWLSDGLREINELIVRKGKGRGKLFTGLTYRVRKAEDPQARRNVASVLEPRDVERNGVDVEVKFKRTSLTEMRQAADYWLNLLDKNVVDLNTVRDELDIEEPERMQRAVLRDKSLQDERLLKTLIGQALRRYHQKGGDLEMLRTWFEERAKETQAAMAPPQPAGMPSPPGAPQMPPGPGAPEPPVMPG